ncbi:choline transporter-like protein 2 isoform X2 [Phymastichus coffea]|uniref:choline transporter-like protein 2 isoform X2 n=1 Tax=Phymastichus coffea TaxID=108790 RepID=UPI00273B8D26|nr:choline transporter-like protein 2 isoform X2 [Phymastichus coffea]
MQTKIQNTVVLNHTLHVNPIQEDRKPTNSLFIFIFSLIFLVWFSVSIQALAYPMHIDRFEDEHKHAIIQKYRIDTQNQIEELEIRFDGRFIFYSVVSASVAIIYMYLLTQTISRFMIYLSTILLIIGLVVYVVVSLIIAIPFDHIHRIILFSFSLVYLLYHSIVLMCLQKIGFKTITDIIKDSCRAVILCPSIIIFTCIMSAIIILVFAFSLYIFKCIALSNNDCSHIIAYCCVDIIGGIIIVSFLINFTQIAISEYTINWFWTDDKNLVTHSFISSSIEKTIGYHMGTVAFASIPLLPNICASFHVCTCQYESDGVIKKENIFIRFISQIALIFYIKDYALIHTSIYGFDFSNSAVAAIALVSENASLFLAATEISNLVLLVGAAVATVPFAIEDHPYLALYSFPLPFFILLVTAIRALLVNKMIIQSTSEILKEKLEV